MLLTTRVVPRWSDQTRETSQGGSAVPMWAGAGNWRAGFEESFESRKSCANHHPVSSPCGLSEACPTSASKGTGPSHGSFPAGPSEQASPSSQVGVLGELDITSAYDVPEGSCRGEARGNLSCATAKPPSAGLPSQTLALGSHGTFEESLSARWTHFDSNCDAPVEYTPHSK